MKENPIFECKYCNYKVESTNLEDVRKKAQNHLIEKHEQRIRGEYNPNLQRIICSKKECNVYVKKDLYCAHGHDNIEQYTKWLAKHFTKNR